MTELALEHEDALAAFEHLYGHPPTHAVRAPGRVNLIGEHIDYNLLPVLPMAIQREIRILCCARPDDRVRVVTTRPQFRPRNFAMSSAIPPYRVGDWGNYAKAAAQVVARMRQDGTGMDAMIDTSLPIAAGLSSSSALAVGIAWALLAVHGATSDRLELAAALAVGERYVGTEGGGMDQAIALCAESGRAARVDFAPLRVTHVPVPPDWRFIVAHSMTKAAKAGPARETYNQRTRECKEALRRVRRAAGAARTRAGYPQLLDAIGPVKLLAAGRRALHGVLLRRFRHVVTEADRVRRAQAAMTDGDLAEFGTLMSGSHVSLRDDYEVSTPALDMLVQEAERHGAVGARLTGAGLGGCVVMLCQRERETVLREALAETFYEPRGIREDLAQIVFTVEPTAAVTATVIS